MTIYSVDTKESFQDLIGCLQEGATLKHLENDQYSLNNKDVLEFNSEYKQEMELHDIIYGANKETNIVNISLLGDDVHIFKEKDGVVTSTAIPFRHWVLGKRKYNDTFHALSGTQPYKFYKDYSKSEYDSVRKELYALNLYTIFNHIENHMVRTGTTYFKGMKLNDVSVLSFDIETSGLDPKAEDAQVFLITNTYRSQGVYQSKTFCLNDFDSEYSMIAAWTDWVRDTNPSVLIGHNIVMFDIPYLKARANAVGKELSLGRGGQDLTIEDRPREFRKDGSQSYTYHRVACFGREIVDTFFLSIKADIARKYESYRLKSIIKHEGLEEEGRVMYEASDIKKNWDNPEERKKIIAYAEADSRDPIKLFDLMAAPFFYSSPVIPKPFQMIMESATGSQINALMVRSYLQLGMSVAEATVVPEFQGAISFAVPGVYKNMLKIDFSALYPSIMRQYKVYDAKKDPLFHFTKIVNYFHDYRQEYKSKFKETGDKFYDDQQNVAKVIANSCYGFLAANGLNYNSPQNAAFITAKARELLIFSIKWATGKEVDYWLNLFQEKTK